MFARSRSPEISQKVLRRVSRCSTDELTLWAEQIILSLHPSYRRWQNHAEPEMLVEARLGSEALHAILEELCQRNGYGK